MNKYLLIGMLLTFSKLFSQGEASNWYFGYGGGLQFNLASGNVSSNDSGQLFTNEGCATMSDSDGNLQFYTDGRTVYNKNHSPMANGTGLLGDASSTQSAIVIPKPNSDFEYYIFTVDNGLDGINHGLNYSIVDMSLNNGDGEVTVKNINLLPYCSEKISSVKANCVTGSFWLVTLSTEDGLEGPLNTYYAFDVYSSGIRSNPVKSTFQLGEDGNGLGDARGYLVLSPDGSKMASANARSGLFLYDFNNQTGAVSNQIELPTNPDASFSYGVAFSPNNRFLYVHSSNDYINQGNNNDSPEDHFSILSQFDLNESDVASSEIVLDRRNLYRGGLQLGPNGKIYRALSATYNLGLNYLGVINSPNLKGNASNYVHQGIDISPNRSGQGLPPFIQSIFEIEVDIIRNGGSSLSVAVCEGESINLGTISRPGNEYQWYKNGELLDENRSRLEVSDSGHYELEIIPNNDFDCPQIGQAYVTSVSKPLVNSTSIIQCDTNLNGDGFTIFNLSQIDHFVSNGLENAEVYYYKNFEEAANDINRLNPNNYENISNPQTVIVKVIDPKSGCYNFGEIELIVGITSTQDATIEVCDNDGIEDGIQQFDLSYADSLVVQNSISDYTISYYESEVDALLEQNPLNLIYNNISPYSQLIYARVENDNQCFGINEITLIVHNLPNVETESEYKYCLNFSPDTITLDPGILDGHISDFTYQWSTGETTPTIEVNTAGSYTVIVTNNFNCTKERTIRVTPSNIATIENITVKDVSDNNEIAIMVSGEGDYEFSLNNENGPYQNSNVLEDVPAGLHTVYIRDINGCGIIEDMVSVIGFPKFFTPNNDGHNDRWKVYGMSANFQSESIIYIYDRYGKLLTELNPSGPGWDGTYLGEILPSTDYWFSVLLEDGRLFKGHFSLRR